jgi:hypothetical protein
MASETEEQEVGYDLADWGPELRAELNNALAEVGVPARWESDELVVPEGDAELVEELIDEIGLDEEDALEVDEDDKGDDEGANVLSAFYVSADILQHDPQNSQAVVELLEAVEVAARIETPFGMEDEDWAEVRAVAEALADRLGDESDDEYVIEAAKRVREVVQPLV